MGPGGLDLPPIGSEGKVLKANETYFGSLPEDKQPKSKTTGRPFQPSTVSKGKRNKRPIIALVDRGGEVCSFHVPCAALECVVGIVRGNIARETRLHIDEGNLYKNVGREFVSHETVNHASKEYGAIEGGERKRLTYHRSDKAGL